jgi:hypothetical protein
MQSMTTESTEQKRILANDDDDDDDDDDDYDPTTPPELLRSQAAGVDLVSVLYSSRRRQMGLTCSP